MFGMTSGIMHASTTSNLLYLWSGHFYPYLTMVIEVESGGIMPLIRSRSITFFSLMMTE